MNRRSFIKRASNVILGTVAFFYCPLVAEDIVLEQPQKLGWVVYEEIGTVIINDRAVSRIELAGV